MSLGKCLIALKAFCESDSVKDDNKIKVLYKDTKNMLLKGEPYGSVRSKIKRKLNDRIKELEKSGEETQKPIKEKMEQIIGMLPATSSQLQLDVEGAIKEAEQSGLLRECASKTTSFTAEKQSTTKAQKTSESNKKPRHHNIEGLLKIIAEYNKKHNIKVTTSVQ